MLAGERPTSLSLRPPPPAEALSPRVGVRVSVTTRPEAGPGRARVWFWDSRFCLGAECGGRRGVRSGGAGGGLSSSSGTPRTAWLRARVPRERGLCWGRAEATSGGCAEGNSPWVRWAARPRGGAGCGQALGAGLVCGWLASRALPGRVSRRNEHPGPDRSHACPPPRGPSLGIQRRVWEDADRCGLPVELLRGALCRTTARTALQGEPQGKQEGVSALGPCRALPPGTSLRCRAGDRGRLAAAAGPLLAQGRGAAQGTRPRLRRSTLPPPPPPVLSFPVSPALLRTTRMEVVGFGKSVTQVSRGTYLDRMCPHVHLTRRSDRVVDSR